METAGTCWRSAKFFYAGIAAARLESLGHRECVGRDAQRGVVVKPAPAPSLIVAQPEVRLQILVIALYAPAHLGNEHHLLQGGVFWGREEEIFRWLGITFGPDTTVAT